MINSLLGRRPADRAVDRVRRRRCERPGAGPVHRRPTSPARRRRSSATPSRCSPCSRAASTASAARPTSTRPRTSTCTSGTAGRRAARTSSRSSVRTPGASAPTLTLNGGLRWDIQTAFSPNNSIMSRSFYADACGVSGIGADGQCSFYTPGATGGVAPSLRRVPEGVVGLQHRLEQLRAERRRGVAAERAERHVCAPCWATPIRRCCGPATRWPTTARAGRLHGPVRGQSRQLDERLPERRAWQPGHGRPAATRSTCRSRAGSGLAVSRPAPTLSDHGRRAAPTASTSSTRTSRSPRPAPTPRLPAALTRDMAFEIRYVGTRARTSGASENYNETEHREQRVPRRVQARDVQPPGQHRGRTGQHVRLLRRGHGHRAAADRTWPTSTAGMTRRTRRPTPARTGRTPRSSAGWRRRTPIRRVPPATSTATPAAVPTPRRRTAGELLRRSTLT